MKSHHKRIILCFILGFFAILDFITFFFNRFSALEMNPIYLLTGSIIFFSLLKFGVNVAIIYSILRPNKRWLIQFFFVLMTVYMIIGQGFGAYSNLKVTHDINQELKDVLQEKQREKEAPLTEEEIEQHTDELIELSKYSKEEAISQYNKVAFLLILYPILTALVGFKIWEKVRKD